MVNQFPPSFDPRALSPKLLLYDLTNSLQYEYDAAEILPGGTQDFTVSQLDLDLQMGENYGTCVFTINDYQNLLTDLTTIRRPSKIKRQWDCQLYLGKSSSSLERWFYGKILDAKLIRAGTNQQQIQVSCVGKGIRFKDRQTNIKRFQATLSDGITMDDTDTTAKVSELVKNMLTTTDHLPFSGLADEAGFTTNGVQDIDVKLANIQFNFSTIAAVMSFLAGAGNCIWGVDADMDVFFRDPYSVSSGFLFTNDLDGSNLDTQNWDPTKLGFVKNGAPFAYDDSSMDAAYSILYGVGGEAPNLDINQTSANATYSGLPSHYLAIPFTPTKDNLRRFGFLLSKTGTPPNDAKISLCGADGSGNPLMTDLRSSLTAFASLLQTLPGAGAFKYFTFPAKQPTTPTTKLFLVINLYGSVGNTINLDYQTGSGTYYISSDGVTWTAQTGTFGLRTYQSKASVVILQDTRATNKYGIREKPITFTNVDELTVRNTLLNISDTLAVEQRIYDDIVITPTTSRIPLGMYCRLYDKFNGLNTQAVITEVKLSMKAGDDASNLGADKITVSLEDWF